MSKLKEPSPEEYDPSYIISNNKFWKLILWLFTYIFMSKNNLDYFSAPLFGNTRKISAEYESLLPYVHIKSYSKGNTWLHGDLVLAFCVSLKLSTWARIEGEGSSCLCPHAHCYFLCCHFFPQFSKEETEILSNFMPKPSSCCITSNGNVFCLMIKSNQNPLASIQPHCLSDSCLFTAAAAVSNLQGQCCQNRCLSEAWMALGRKMTDSAQQLAKLEKRFLVKYVKNNSSLPMTWGEKWETSLRQMAIPC